MKLSIDDLRVDSYSTQLSEVELTELKGGVTPAVWLGYAAVAAAVTAVAAVAVAVVNAANDHKECGTRTTEFTNPDGSKSTITEHICRE